MARPKDHPFRAIFRTDPFGWTKFAAESVGFGQVGAIHKGYLAEKPFRFPNEYIAGRIGHAISLPIPPFAFTRFVVQPEVELESQILFSSIDFNYERETDPLPEPDVLIEKMAPECAGMLAFDILIANPDRSKANFWCDSPGSPTKILIYDHDTALLGAEHDGVERLIGLQEELGLRWWHDGIANHHPFLRKLPSGQLLDDWFNRIYTIPKSFIHQTCDEARQFGIDKGTAKQLEKFISYRSKNLEDIVRRHRREFTAASDWNEGLFK